MEYFFETLLCLLFRKILIESCGHTVHVYRSADFMQVRLLEILLSWVELSSSYGRWSVDQFVLVSSSHLGPMIRFYPYPFFSDNCLVVLPVGRPLWREDGSVIYSEVADWSGHWGPITIHYRLIWDCVPFLSPLTNRRGYGGGILTRLYMGL
jgi:hypothetical protein